MVRTISPSGAVDHEHDRGGMFTVDAEGSESPQTVNTALFRRLAGGCTKQLASALKHNDTLQLRQMLAGLRKTYLEAQEILIQRALELGVPESEAFAETEHFLEKFGRRSVSRDSDPLTSFAMSFDFTEDKSLTGQLLGVFNEIQEHMNQQQLGARFMRGKRGGRK